MNGNFCTQEENVVHSARTGCWDDSTKAHLANCAYCREIAGIAEWMRNVAQTDVRDVVLPEPGRIFCKAQLAAAEKAKKKALRPLLIAEFVLRIAVILALAAAIFGAWFGFRFLAANALVSFPHVPQPIHISAAALATGLIALLFTKIAQPVLIDE